MSAGEGSDEFRWVGPSFGEEPTHWSPVLPVTIFLVAFCALTWPWLAGYVTIPWDAKAHFQPQVQFLAASLARGEWPWWNPYVFSGHPQIADPQSMIFSPPFIVLALIDPDPSLWSVDATVLATMALGGIGLMLWFRDRGWYWAGAIVAALAFSFGAAMAWRVQHTGQVLSLAYLPWAMLLLERAIVRSSFGYATLTGMVTAALLLGRDQVALLALYLLAGRGAWALAERWLGGTTILRPLAASAWAGIVTILLAAVPLLFTVLLAADSNRPVIDLEGAGRGSLHPAQLTTFVIPQLFGPAGHMADYWGPPSFAWPDTGLFTAQNVGQLYVGAIPLLLVLGAALTGRLWERQIRFFTVALVLILLYALGWYTPAFRAYYALLPGVSLYRRPADAVFLIGALMAILAGYSTHRLFTEPWHKPSRRVGAVIAISLVATALLAIGLGLAIDRLPRVPAPLAGATLAFATAAGTIAWARRRVAFSARLAACGLVAVLTVDLALNNGPSTSSALPTAEYEVFEPESRNPTIRALQRLTIADATRRDRVELAGLGFHWPNAAMTHRLQSTLGYNPVRLGLYTRATGAGDNIGQPGERRFTPLMPSYRSPLADMLGLRFIATPVPIEQIDAKLAPDAFRRVADTAEGTIYENTDALPRVLFATQARAADFEQLLATGAWPELDPRDTVLLETLPRGPTSPRRPGSARIIEYRNTVVTIEVDSPDGGFLVLNDVWHSWWRAEIDGNPIPLQRANVLFRAVEVPAGRRRVVFTFRPLVGLWETLRRRHPPAMGSIEQPQLRLGSVDGSARNTPVSECGALDEARVAGAKDCRRLLARSGEPLAPPDLVETAGVASVAADQIPSRHPQPPRDPNIDGIGLRQRSPDDRFAVGRDFTGLSDGTPTAGKRHRTGRTGHGT